MIQLKITQSMSSTKTMFYFLKYLQTLNGCIKFKSVTLKKVIKKNTPKFSNFLFEYLILNINID